MLCRPAVRLFGSLTLLLMAATGAVGQTPAANDAKSSLYSYDRQPLSRIAPAVELPDGLSGAGWNHLIVISTPKLVAGDLEQLPPSAERYADLFLTVLAASTDTEVRDEGTRYVLKDVGIALATRVGDRDVTISRETMQQQGAQIGLLGPLALAAAEQRLDDVKRIARSPTIALVDSPAVFVHNGENVAAVMRHAVMVDPRNGRVDTLIWEIELNDREEYRAVRGNLRLLPPRLEFVNQLRVDINRFRLTMPEPTAFAMVTMPPGEVIRPGTELAELAALPRMAPATMYHLEVRLWDALYSVANPSSATAQP